MVHLATLGRANAGRRRRRPAVNTDPQTWKACWRAGADDLRARVGAAYSSEIRQPWRAMTVLDCYLHMRYAAPFNREQGCAGSYGSKGWGSSPSERARVLADQRHLSSLSRGSRRSAGAFLVLFVTRPFRTCRRRRSARRAPGRATPAARRPDATTCGRSRRPCDCHTVWYVIVL